MMVLITPEVRVFKQVAAHFPKHTHTHIWKQASYANSSQLPGDAATFIYNW